MRRDSQATPSFRNWFSSSIFYEKYGSHFILSLIMNYCRLWHQGLVSDWFYLMNPLWRFFVYQTGSYNINEFEILCSIIFHRVLKFVFLLCHIYTFVRVARRMTSVLITYSPRHLLRHSPRHSWRSLWKRFFEQEWKGTNGDSHNVYVRTWKQFFCTETEAYECSYKWRDEARARMCKCGISFQQKSKNFNCQTLRNTTIMNTVKLPYWDLPTYSWHLADILCTTGNERFCMYHLPIHLRRKCFQFCIFFSYKNYFLASDSFWILNEILTSLYLLKLN